MNLQDVTTQRRAGPVDDTDWKELPDRYPLDNILGDIENKSRRRLNWFSAFATVTLVLGIIVVIMEAM